MTECVLIEDEFCQVVFLQNLVSSKEVTVQVHSHSKAQKPEKADQYF